MIGDYYTKPLQGGKFLKFRKLILGEVDNGDQGDQGKAGQQENQEIRKLDVKERGRDERRILVLEPPWYGSTRTTGVCWRESF